MIKLAIWYSATPKVASGHKRVFELFFEKRAADHIVKESTMHVMMKLAMMGELSKYWQHTARVVVLAMMAQVNAFTVFTQPEVTFISISIVVLYTLLGGFDCAEYCKVRIISR
jgi:hypothetical protein